ncbi:MAG: LLM class flavin-dependent oxidoreductase [Candidatus Thorarchaeota archaeon]
MQLGVYIRNLKNYNDMLSVSLLAEKLNYYGLFLNDHIHGFADNGREPYLEAWTTMSAIAAKTSKIRIGHVVLFNSLRNPTYLAKSISTLDNISQGRYEVLIGAGWNIPEYNGYDLMGKGRGMPSAKERVERLKESVQILKGMFSQSEFSFEGKYWILKNAYNFPSPIQNPLRITIGCDKPRLMRLAIDYADGFNTGGDLSALDQKLNMFKSIAKKVEKNLSNYFISGFTGIQIAKNLEEYETFAKNLSEQTKRPLEDIKTNSLVGTSEILIEKLLRANDMGVQMIIFAPRQVKSKDEFIEKLELIHDTVLPYIK